MDFFPQQQFHDDWGHLQDPHVRSLAWLLSSPHLLKQDPLTWDGANVAPTMPPMVDVAAFLTSLDQNPAALHLCLRTHPTKRLGLYAETLLAFFLAHFYDLYAHGLQIHDGRARTIGEFDFLVRQPEGLVHWELATKFYLFFDEMPDVASNAAMSSTSNKVNLFNYLGPNLADTLGAKMHKIVYQQLRLGETLEARKVLPSPLFSVQAFIKGWLFYRDAKAFASAELVDGIADEHCRGYIWCLNDLQQMADFSGVILERLAWLAPVQISPHESMSKQELLEKAMTLFFVIKTPVMLAITEVQQGFAREICRGMLVPDDWWEQARSASARLLPPQDP